MPNDQPPHGGLTGFANVQPEPVLRAGHDCVITDANTAARLLFAPRDLMGMRWCEVIPLPAPDFWTRLLQTDEVLEHDVDVGGRTFSFRYYTDSAEEAVYIHGRDITAVRLAEAQLHDSERLSVLGSHMAYVTHELKNPALAARRGASQLRGALALLQDAIAPLTQLHLTRERAGELMALAREDRDRTGRMALHDPLTRSDNEARVEEWLEEHDIPDAWDLAPGLVSLGYDVDALEALSAQWGEATGAVLVWVARAQPLLTLVREIEESTRRLSEIIDTLRSQTQHGRSAPAPVDVADGLESTLMILRGKIGPGITIVRDYSTEVPPVEGFSGELNQVWTNLIDNAVDALDGHGTLTLRTRRDLNHVIIEVCDDGHGIPEDVLRQLFKPFFTTKPPGKGTGLGLATSKRIVTQRHGGTIEVTSAPEGGSTRFIVRLPIRLQPQASDGNGRAQT